MKWNTQRKVSVGVLVVAAAGFGIDSFVRSSSAVEPTADNLAVSTTGETPRPVPSTRASAHAMALLAGRLETVSAGAHLSTGRSDDAFATPPQWLTDAGKKASAQGRLSARSETFRNTHRLSGVMQQPQRPADSVVVIGSKTLRVGDTLDGFRLASIGERSAGFVQGDEHIELALPQPSLATTR